MLDHERLEVYQFAVRFDRLVVGFGAFRARRDLREQLERASVGVMACIAEGAGRRSPAEKRHYYAMARGSATECAAHLDALRTRNLIDTAQLTDGKSLLLSIVRMLTRLSTRHENEPEPTSPYTRTRTRTALALGERHP
jgi:four helix bundle protein